MTEFFSFLANNWSEVSLKIREHFALVLISITIATSIGVPLGIAATKWPRLRTPVIGAANIVQTIPSLAMFGFLIPMPFIGGIGPRTAIIALVLYALLPIVRNTYAGIETIPDALKEAALGMGMTGRQLLWFVELPLALPILLAGIRVAAVTCVGVATIASLIGAGGLGDFIFRGVSTLDSTVILAGAVPAAVMALLLDGGLHLLEKKLDWKDR